jgi:hypothetical protein
MASAFCGYDKSIHEISHIIRTINYFPMQNRVNKISAAICSEEKLTNQSRKVHELAGYMQLIILTSPAIWCEPPIYELRRTRAKSIIHAWHFYFWLIKKRNTLTLDRNTIIHVHNAHGFRHRLQIDFRHTSLLTIATCCHWVVKQGDYHCLNLTSLQLIVQPPSLRSRFSLE